MSEERRPRTQVTEMARIVEVWNRIADQIEWNDPAPDERIAKAEEAIGRPVPDALRCLYEMSDGMEVLDSFFLFSLLPEPGTEGAADHERFGNLASASALMREWDNPLPEEVVIIGNDGGDETYGLWLPAGTGKKETAPVLAFGEGCESYAVVGTNLGRFLTWMTAFRCLLREVYDDAEIDPDIYGAMGVPPDWMKTVKEEEELPDIRWADPDLPSGDPDPYSQDLSPDDLRGMLGG